MAVYKRNKKPDSPYWCRFSIGGRSVRKSCYTTDKQKAEQYEQALRDRYWRQAKLGENVHTWKEAVARLRKEASWRAHTRAANERAFAFFAHINHIPLAAIDVSVVAAAREYVERTQAASSANRQMAVFRGVLRAAVRWGWLAYCPPVPMRHVPERDPAWLSPSQCEALVKELPAHLKAPVIFSLLTGLRMANVRDLKWANVDETRGLAWIPSLHNKARKLHSVSLPPLALALLKSLERTNEWVFTYQGRKISGTFNTKAFRKACKRAGVAIRWHDLRHTFASWLALDGAAEGMIAKMGGWTTTAMVGRYSHLRTADTLAWASAISTNLGTALQNMGISVGEKPEQNQQNKMVPAEGIEPSTPSLRIIRLSGRGK